MKLKELFLFSFIAIIACSVFSEELIKNGITFQWDYSQLKPDNFAIGEVIRNVDSNSIIVTLKDSIEFVKLIGVSTLEAKDENKTKKESEQISSNFTKTLCPVGSTVYLSYEKNLRDPNYRLLAYLWFKVEDKWILHNLNLISNGYATVNNEIIFRNDYQIMFRNAEAYAKLNNIGLWGNHEELSTTYTNTEQTRKKLLRTSDASVIISNVMYYGSDESVELKNTGNIPINLDGWRILSVSGEQEYYLSDITLNPRETFSIHSGKEATVNVWTNAYIHNNRGDAVRVYDSFGKLVDYFGWGEYKE